jgi:shikimate dehydrogenase
MKIVGETKVLGIFGYPIRHTLSPLMQNAAIEALGLNYVYVPFEVSPSELEAALKGIRALGIKGVNITVPHKEKVISFLDEVREEASLIGAVNTIENRNGRLIGHNTDARGYISALREDAGFDPRGKRVLVIGAGGAARGIIAGLSIEGVSNITIANRTVEKGEALVEEFGKVFHGIRFAAHPLSSLKDPRILSSIGLIINTTSVGLKEGALDVDFTLTPSQTLVSDIVYKPPLTPFLKKAREAGRKTIGGLGMLIYQGAISLEIWTSKKAPVEVMKKSLAPYF